MGTEEQGQIVRLREQLIGAYFSDPGRVLTLSAGEVLIPAGKPHDRLYMVISGRLTEGGIHEGGPGGRSYDAGDLVGISTFFVPDGVAERPVVAQSATHVAFIDESVEPVLLADTRRDLAGQFMPLVVEQLGRRDDDANTNPYTLAGAHTERHLNRLLSLGQLATGIAHELNNSLTVLATGADWLCEITQEEMATREGLAALFFEAGLGGSRQLNAWEAREKAKSIEEELDLTAGDALSLARTGIALAALKMAPREYLNDVPGLCLHWEMGATLYDMRLAASQAEHVVQSVKTLGTRQERRRRLNDVNDTIRSAVCLTRNCHKMFRMETVLDELPMMAMNPGELIQVWTNLIRNACEAMKQVPAERASLRVTSTLLNGWVEVVVQDTGPGVPPEILPDIFTPHVTTREDGTGLGLTIVNQFVSEYGGTINVESSPAGATFRVRLPAPRP